MDTTPAVSVVGNELDDGKSLLDHVSEVAKPLAIAKSELLALRKGHEPGLPTAAPL